MLAFGAVAGSFAVAGAPASGVPLPGSSAPSLFEHPTTRSASGATKPIKFNERVLRIKSSACPYGEPPRSVTVEKRRRRLAHAPSSKKSTRQETWRRLAADSLRIGAVTSTVDSVDAPVRRGGHEDEPGPGTDVREHGGDGPIGAEAD